MGRFIDLTGQKFNRLTVMQYLGKDKWGISKWICRCDCNRTIIVTSNHLKSGHTKSCGCLKKEGNAKTHGKEGTKIYQIWENMKKRCNNKNCPQYKDYGGRKIKVCKRWMKFENFYKDVGDSPKGKFLDRIDNNEGYFPYNWRWTTRKINNRNKRNNHLEIYKNKTQCRSAWEEKYDLPRNTLHRRIDKLGWSLEKALTTPVRKHKKYNKRKRI